MAVRLTERNLLTRKTKDNVVYRDAQKAGPDFRISYNRVHGISLIPVRHLQVESTKMSNGEEIAIVNVICYAYPPVWGWSAMGVVSTPYYKDERIVYKGRSTRVSIFPKEYTISVD